MNLKEIKMWRATYNNDLSFSMAQQIDWLIAEVTQVNNFRLSELDLYSKSANKLQAENQRLRDGLGELIDKPDYTNLSGRIVPEGIVYAIKRLLEEE
jgi:hypothetical protein